MAFRRFYEAETPKPEGMPYTAHAVSGLVDSIARRQMAEQTAKRNAMAQYKADSYAMKFNSDQEDINVMARDITSQAVQEMMASPAGQTSTQLKDRQVRASGYKDQSGAQWQQLQDLQGTIAQTKFETGGKNYYNPKPDADRLIEAAYGRDGERVTWFNRGERLDAVSKTLGKDLLQSFDKEGYLSDYVEGMKTTVRENKNKSLSGYEKGSKVDAVFLNKNGVPEVTDDHAINYLHSSKYVTARYQQELDQQLISEAKKMQATPQGEWMKGLADDQIVAELRNDPTKNTINQVAPGIRERNLAKIDLEKKQRVNLMNSTDAGQYDPDAARGITSKFFTVAPSFDRNSFGGSGGKLTSKSGDRTGVMIPLKGRAYDTAAGRLTGNDRSSRDAKITGYNLAVVQNGTPVNLQAETPEEYIAKINALPLYDIRKMDLKTVIKGQAFNKPEILSNARIERDKLEVKPNKTEEEKGSLEAIKKVIDLYQADPELGPEVLQSALRGILGTIVEDLVKVVEPRDPETIDIQNKLGRYNITDPKNWSSDDKAIAEAFNKRKAEAISSEVQETSKGNKPLSDKMKYLPETDKALPVGTTYTEGTWGAITWNGKDWVEADGKVSAFNNDFKKKPVSEILANPNTKTHGKAKSIPTVASDADYSKLPSGSVFIAPDGKQYKKP